MITKTWKSLKLKTLKQGHQPQVFFTRHEVKLHAVFLQPPSCPPIFFKTIVWAHAALQQHKQIRDGFWGMCVCERINFCLHFEKQVILNSTWHLPSVFCAKYINFADFTQRDASAGPLGTGWPDDVHLLHPLARCGQSFGGGGKRAFALQYLFKQVLQASSIRQDAPACTLYPLLCAPLGHGDKVRG